MSSDFKFTKELIQLRRAKVLELLAKGQNQVTIAKTLNVSTALIYLDLQYLNTQAQKELETHISERLPFEYFRAMSGMNTVLAKVSELLENATDTKTKMECLKLQMELYRSILSIASDGGIVERAMKMVKVIAPLPGEKIPTKEELEAEENEEVETESESEEDLKEG